MCRPAIVIVIALLSALRFTTAQQLNKQLTADSLYETTVINPEADKAYIHVRSQVPNLRFDSNRRIDKVTQLSSGDWEVWLPTGTHILKIDAMGFQRLELPARNFGRRKSYELSIRAIEMQSMLKIITEPNFADVYIDNQFKGKSDLILNLSPGKHGIMVDKRFFRREFKEIELEKDSTSEVRLALVKNKGVINIYGTDGAIVYMNNDSLGMIPLKDIKIGAGESYHFRAHKEGLSDEERDIEISEEAETKNVELTLHESGMIAYNAISLIALRETFDSAFSDYNVRSIIKRSETRTGVGACLALYLAPTTFDLKVISIKEEVVSETISPNQGDRIVTFPGTQYTYFDVAAHLLPVRFFEKICLSLGARYHGIINGDGNPSLNGGILMNLNRSFRVDLTYDYYYSSSTGNVQAYSVDVIYAVLRNLACNVGYQRDDLNLVCVSESPMNRYFAQIMYTWQ